jgi:hypothetical protein
MCYDIGKNKERNMTWVQVLTIVLANVGLCVTLFLWLRKESNANRKEFVTSQTTFFRMWAEESKDFRARLCAIEERGRWESRKS